MDNYYLKRIIPIKSKFLRCVLAVTGCITAFAVCVAILWLNYIFLYGNFHKIDKNFYRSAQLFSFNMPYYIEKNHIQSVLNLRGRSTQKWYVDEIKIARDHHVSHYDYRLSDSQILNLQQMNKVIEIIKLAPKPILVHCKSGADRSALVSALYAYAINHDQNAEKQISIVYGHFPWLGSKTSAMDASFQIYKDSN
jgi:protein tyrosine phosphatase (PTP) superfamily phosphohydrolase (DUF442 family)